MKRTILFFTLLFLGVFLFSVRFAAFAQSTTLFAPSPFFVQKITGYQHNADEPVQIDPITTITIPKDSFSNQVTLYVYKGINSQIQSLLPSGQSPISFYGVILKDSDNRIVTPKTAIRIQIDATKIDSIINFYPIINGGIDRGLQKQYNPKTLNSSLMAINDNGFVVTAMEAVIPPANQATTNSQNSLLTTIVALIIVIFAICIIFFIILKKTK